MWGSSGRPGGTCAVMMAVSLTGDPGGTGETAGQTEALVHVVDPLVGAGGALGVALLVVAVVHVAVLVAPSVPRVGHTAVRRQGQHPKQMQVHRNRGKRVQKLITRVFEHYVKTSKTQKR